MNRLNIQQSSNVEIVGADLILKLYETALTTSDITLVGNLQCEHCKESAYNYLTGTESGVRRFPNLLINVTAGMYKSFVDPAVDEFFAKCPAGDGLGILLGEWNKLTDYWGSRGTTYGYIANNNYFGINAETAENNIPLINCLKRIQHFPEIVDIPFCQTGYIGTNPFGGHYCPAFLHMENIREIYIPRTCSYAQVLGSHQYLQVIDFTTSDSYVCPSFGLNAGASHPSLIKIALPPSVTHFVHGTLAGNGDCADGLQIFMYATDLSGVPSDASTWTLEACTNCTLWVPDSAYNDYVQHKQISPKITAGKITVKRFSEYTGNDLVQKFLPTSE